MFNETEARADIAARNDLRLVAGLPLLPVEAEIERMKTHHVRATFESFANKHRSRALREVLGDWRPSGISWLYAGRLTEDLLHRWHAETTK